MPEASRECTVVRDNSNAQDTNPGHHIRAPTQEPSTPRDNARDPAAQDWCIGSDAASPRVFQVYACGECTNKATHSNCFFKKLVKDSTSLFPSEGCFSHALVATQKVPGRRQLFDEGLSGETPGSRIVVVEPPVVEPKHKTLDEMR